jgi:hypothetical protein
MWTILSIFISSNAEKYENKRPFLTNKKFVFLFNWEIFMKKS